MVFGFFFTTKKVDDTKTYCNDAHPSYETTRARFIVHKQIRDGQVPILRHVSKPVEKPITIAGYKKGSNELYETHTMLIDNNIDSLESPSLLRPDKSFLDQDNLITVEQQVEKKKKSRKRRRKR